MKQPTTEAILRKLRKMEDADKKFEHVYIRISADGMGDYVSRDIGDEIDGHILNSWFDTLPEAMTVANRLMKGK